MGKKDYIKFETQNGAKESIVDLVEIGDSYMLQLKNPINKLNTLLDNGTETHNVNIAIAAAVTAYARIHMSQFKNNTLFPNLYYSDTDSVYFDGPLPDSFISTTELGKLKLEGIWANAVFLSPKVYSLISSNVSKQEIHSKDNKDNLVIKIKGVTEKALMNRDNNINFNMFESLLYKNQKFEIDQNKWFRSIVDANFTISEQVYSLKVTNNKRELVYDFNNKLIKTNPLILVDGKIND